MEPVIQIASVIFDEPLDAKVFDFYCSQLPIQEQGRLRRFKRWEDATASVTGKILLMKLLESMGMKDIGLSDLQYSDEDRPFFNGGVDFNISHSGNCVGCAVALGGKVGFDMEKVRDIKISDLKYVLSGNESQLVETSENPNKAFYQIWTQKEAIVKADGCGLNAVLNEIDTTRLPVKLGDELWYVKQFSGENDYVMSVAYNNQDSEIEYKSIGLS